MKVSIGLPFYNAADTLADAIRSVFAQTYQDWELLLVDDGSTDNSLAIARAIVDRRVVVVSDGINRGLVFRLNQIARLASGRYLARMDADDFMHPERIERQMQYLTSHSELDLVDAPMYSVCADGTTLGVRGLDTLDFDAFSVLRHGTLLHATALGHTEWFRNNPYDATYVRAEDRELWCRTLRHSRFGRVPQPLYFCREHYSFKLSTYLQSSTTLRKIYRTYGPELVGYPAMILLLVNSYAKDAVMAGFTALGRQGHIIARRNKSLSDPERRAANAILQQILQTDLPVSTPLANPTRQLD